MKRIGLPSILFAFTSLAVLLFGLLFQPLMLDIAVHDTYYIIPHWHISTAISLLLLFVSFTYFLFLRIGRPLRKNLSVAHYSLTLLCLLALGTIVLLPSQRFDHMSEEMEHLGKINIIISVSVMVGIIGQVLFILNGILSIFKKRY